MAPVRARDGAGGGRRGAAAGFRALPALLLDRRERLPSRLVRAAEYALAHPDEIAFGTVASVAEAAEIQPSALIRSPRRLGYNGFSSCKRSSGIACASAGRHTASAWQSSDRGPGRPGRAACKRFSASSALSLAKLDDTVVPEDLERAVSVLAGAATIHLLGLRRAFPVASYLAYALGKLQVSANLVDHVGALAGEQIGAARDGDALIAISFTPYTPATIELANAFSGRGFPVVAITDSAFSPLAPAATARIEIVEADVGGFRSLAATFCVAMALAVAVAERRGER